MTKMIKTGGIRVSSLEGAVTIHHNDDDDDNEDDD